MITSVSHGPLITPTLRDPGSLINYSDLMALGYASEHGSSRRECRGESAVILGDFRSGTYPLRFAADQGFVTIHWVYGFS